MTNDDSSWPDLLRIDVHPHRLWTVQELAEVLLHQLRLPLEQKSTHAVGRVIRPTTSGQHSQAEAMTFGDVLHDTHPPLELLLAIKDYAKRHLASPRSVVLPIVAHVLYFASIATALARHDRRITTLHKADIRHGLNWALQLPWLDDRTRAVIELGVACMAVEQMP